MGMCSQPGMLFSPMSHVVRLWSQGVVYEHDRSGVNYLLRPKVTSLRERYADCFAYLVRTLWSRGCFLLFPTQSIFSHPYFVDSIRTMSCS